MQSAWAASHTKTYLAAPYRCLARRRGKKKALVAVAHSLLGSFYQVLAKREAYQELGTEYLDKLAPERLTRQLMKRPVSLGHKVALDPEGA